MISQSVYHYNYLLLSHLKGGEFLKVDQTGKLYMTDKENHLSIFIQKIFQDQRKLQHIIEIYVVDKLKEKKFHDLTSGRQEYLELLNLFPQNQLHEDKKASLAFDFYNQRYKDLVDSGLKPWQAETRVVCEMVDDPNIPSSYKKNIYPEPCEEGYLLKDRAGRHITTVEHLPY